MNNACTSTGAKVLASKQMLVTPPVLLFHLARQSPQSYTRLGEQCFRKTLSKATVRLPYLLDPRGSAGQQTLTHALIAVIEHFTSPPHCKSR